MVNKKIIYLIATILILLVAIVLSLNYSKTTTIGFLSPLTGPSAEMGFSSRNAFIMAFEEYENDQKALSFKSKIEYIIEDDGGNAEQSFEKVQTMLASGIDIFIGHITSSSGRMSIPYINENRALLVSPLISHDGYLGKDDGFISLMPSASNQGKRIAKHLVSTNTNNRVVFLYDPNNIEFCDSVFSGLEDQISEDAGGIIESISLDSNDNLVNVVDYIMSLNPSAVVTVVHVSTLVAINHQIKRHDTEIPVYTSMWAMVPSVIKGYGDELSGVYGVYATNPFVTSKSYTMFKERYYERYGVEVDFAAVYTYDATKLVLEAVSATRSTDPMEIKNWIIETMGYDGVNEPFTINENGDATRDIFLINAQTGQLVFE